MIHLFDLLKCLLKPEWIQAASTVILVGVTTVYVILTRQMLHMPYRAIVKPKEVVFSDEGTTTIKVCNYGPGLVANINIKVPVRQLLKAYAKDDELAKKVFCRLDYIRAEGPDQLALNEIEDYILKGFRTHKYPVIISWESVSGKVYRTYWFLKRELKGTKITRLRGFRLTYFHIERFMQVVRSPFYSVIVWLIKKQYKKDSEEKA